MYTIIVVFDADDDDDDGLNVTGTDDDFDFDVIFFITLYSLMMIMHYRNLYSFIGKWKRLYGKRKILSYKRRNYKTALVEYNK